jgi:hypothetical protein
MAIASHRRGNCSLCGVWRNTLHRDHIIPRCKGGTEDPSNFQYICANCHEDKTRSDLKGRPISSEFKTHLLKCGEGTRFKKGHKHSQGTKAVLSERKIDFWDNPENRQKMSDAHKGQIAWNKGRKREEYQTV